MIGLVDIKNNELTTTSILIAQGVGNQHKNVLALIKRHSGTEILSAIQTRKIKTKGRPQEVVILNELQATFLISLMDNSKIVVDFKQRLVKEFFSMRDQLTQRSQGKLSRKTQTDTIKQFIEYAKSQGSSVGADRYYSNITKMENSALWIVTEEFKNVRDALNGQQLQILSTADLITAKAIHRGMSDQLHYKDIYQNAKRDVLSFVDLVGKTPVPMTVKFIEGCDSE